jgi:ribose transport system permease protein
LSPRFLQPSTLLLILNQASYIGILAVGMTLVLLTAGIDLSVGSIMYLAATVAGLLLQQDLPIAVALAACLATGRFSGP